jgi:hypothetical protein
MSLNALLNESEQPASDFTIHPTSGWAETQPRRVVLTGIRIPFGSAVALLLKWTIAAIPAALVLCAVIALAFLAATQLLGGDGARLIP